MHCQRCSIAGAVRYRARSGPIDVILCFACAAEARQLGFVIETLATRAADEVHPPPPTKEPGTVDKQNFAGPVAKWTTISLLPHGQEIAPSAVSGRSPARRRSR